MDPEESRNHIPSTVINCGFLLPASRGYTCPGGRCQGSRLLSTWKPCGLAQRVGFNRLSRTEAGLQSAEFCFAKAQFVPAFSITCVFTVVRRGKPTGCYAKPPSQYLETLRVSVRESVSTDFHVLRRDFSPTGNG